MVGNTHDTGLTADRDLTGHLEGGVLLTIEGNSHGAYSIHPDNLRITETFDRYLADLELPANESRCILGDPQLHPPG